MKSLNEDLKTGQFKQVYLFCGEEDYLKEQYKSRFIKNIIPFEDNMNYACFTGKKVEVNEIIGQADTMPFFADRRLIVVEDSELFKTGGAELGDYIKNLPDTTYMIFVEKVVDKRSKLYKAVRDKGRVVEFQRQTEATLRTWIRQKVKKENKVMSGDAETLFLSKTGDDMNLISKELDKLLCYALKKDRITVEDVDAICIEQITDNIFDMIDAMISGRQNDALNIYYSLLAQKEPPMRILFLMTKQYRTLYEIKDHIRQGRGRQDIAKKMGLHPFVAGKCMDQAKKFKTLHLRQIIEESADLEQRVKTGKLTDILAVELFLVKYSVRV